MFISGSVLNLAFQNCAGTNTLTKFSLSPEKVISKGDILVNEGGDEIAQSCAAIIKQHHLVDCGAPVQMPDGSTKNRRDYERDLALAEAAADPTGSIIPVEYAISFGTKLDYLADWAHRRSALSQIRTGLEDFTVVPVVDDPNTSAIFSYYKANHASAKQKYITGQKCFYSTVTVNPNQLIGNGGYFDFITSHAPSDQWHPTHYMFAGYSANGGPKHRYRAGAYEDLIPNRLFGATPHSEQVYVDGQPSGVNERQIVKMYVADIRDAHIGLTAPGGEPIVRINESAVRGAEQSSDVSSFIDINTIVANFEMAATNLSETYVNPEDPTKAFGGLDGSKQLLANLCSAAVNGTVLPTQYTPLVFDLGSDLGIYTTDVGDGTYFNMAMVDNKAHKTAWIKGKEKRHILRNSKGQPFYKVTEEAAEDGFLAIPDSKGQITNSSRLFGTTTVVNGKTYRNGFEALQALANKNCESPNIQDQYVGPWDGDLYENVLKVWVDRNKNGVADAGELSSLREAGVAATGVCYTVKYGSKDSKGNSTKFRAIFAHQKPVTASPEEVIQVLEGQPVKSETGAGLSLRLVIDIMFKTDITDVKK